jgi:hypothetical protein
MLKDEQEKIPKEDGEGTKKVSELRQKNLTDF